MSIEFRKRKVTEHIIVLIKDTSCLSYESFYKYRRRMGELDAGVHYFLDADGTIHVARNDECVAGWEYADNNSVYILAQSNNSKLNSSQRYVMPTLLESLQQKYPEADVIERTE